MFRKLSSNKDVRLFFLLTFGLTFSTISCKKEELLKEEFAGEKEIFVGKWNWQYSSHNFGWCDGDNYYELLNPVTEGKTYSVEILKPGIILFFRNDSLIIEYRAFFEYFKNDDNVFSLTNAFAFNINLNNNESLFFGGSVNMDTLRTTPLPLFSYHEGCESYANYFIKE